MDTDKRTKTKMDMTSRRILLYLGITFVLTYAYEFLVVYPAVFSKNQMIAGMGTLFISFTMFIPALGVLLTRLITKEGFQNAWLKPNFKGHVRYYLIGWFAPAVLTVIGIGVYFLIFSGQFDGNMTMLQNVLKQSYAAAGQEVEVTVDAVRKILIVQVLMAFFLAPLLNGINCFGEEWGWRGYLLPKMMEKFSIGKVLLINGLIWGVWHAPLTAIGHNYGTGYWGYPVTGILAMCGFCIVMGVIFSYITIKTGSCLPAVLAHGSLNGIAALGVYFTVDGGNPFVGPAATGIIGGSAFVVTAVVMAVWLVRDEKRKADMNEILKKS